MDYQTLATEYKAAKIAFMQDPTEKKAQTMITVQMKMKSADSTPVEVQSSRLCR